MSNVVRRSVREQEEAVRFDIRSVELCSRPELQEVEQAQTGEESWESPYRLPVPE